MRIYLFTSATSHLKFAHERSVTSSRHEGTPTWTKAKPSSRRSHRKTYRTAEARIYHNCVELAIFIGKVSVHLTFNFLTHRMIYFVGQDKSPRETDDAVLTPFDFTGSVSRKKLARAFSRPGVEATAILATKITWWHRNRGCGCSRLNFKLLLMSRIFVAVEKWWHHAPWWSPGAAKQHPREFDTARATGHKAWECKHDTREFYRSEYNSLFP